MSGSTKSQWKFLHDGTTYFFAGVLKYTSTLSGVFGTNRDSSGNIGTTFYGSDTNQFKFITSKGSSGNIVVELNDSGLMPKNTTLIASALVDPEASAADRIDAFVNETQSLITNSASSSVSASDPTFNLDIGARGDGSGDATGFIAELIIVSGADATEANRQEVINYLNAKWGVF